MGTPFEELQCLSHTVESPGKDCKRHWPLTQVQGPESLQSWTVFWGNTNHLATPELWASLVMKAEDSGGPRAVMAVSSETDRSLQVAT